MTIMGKGGARPAKCLAPHAVREGIPAGAPMLGALLLLVALLLLLAVRRLVFGGSFGLRGLRLGGRHWRSFHGVCAQYPLYGPVEPVAWAPHVHRDSAEAQVGQPLVLLGGEPADRTLDLGRNA